MAYVIQHRDGAKFLGRYDLRQPLTWVPKQFAYTYDTASDADSIRRQACRLQVIDADTAVVVTLTK